jgi:hypothetical protein
LAANFIDGYGYATDYVSILSHTNMGARPIMGLSERENSDVAEELHTDNIHHIREVTVLIIFVI